MKYIIAAIIGVFALTGAGFNGTNCFHPPPRSLVVRTEVYVFPVLSKIVIMHLEHEVHVHSELYGLPNQ